MSVEISGPKGYEYQYMVSLLIALEYLDKDDIQVYIEKQNQEDAQISFTEDGRQYTIDIQAKNRNEDIDSDNFSRWLSHFENRSSDRIILNKIQNDDKRFVVFISNARCKDEVSLFIDNKKIECELKCGFNDNFLNSVRKKISSSYDKGGSSLDNDRKTFINSYMNSINNQKLRDILKRVKIKEKCTNDEIYYKICNILKFKYHVPQSTIDEIILELNDVVKEGRDTSKSITKDLLKIVEKFSGKTLLHRDENYIDRIEKNTCINILDNENILLLTGISLCGKTYLAKDIAQDYLDKGYNVEIMSEVHGENGSITFISNRSSEDRLLILEDPFGQVKTKDNVIEIKNDVEKLLSMSRTNRKIIITSRKDIILDTMRKKELNDCSINSKKWIDLTCVDSSQVAELWKKYFEPSDECNQIYNDMNKWLIKHDHIQSLQLGHVSKIYYCGKNIKELSIEEIVKEARQDSEQLADVVERRGGIASKVFVALGIACNTYKSVKLNDLAFILNDLDEHPGVNFNINKGISCSLHEKLVEEEFPYYSIDFKMQEDLKKELKFLKEHGYIEFDKLKRMHFLHPIYQYAAKLLLIKQFTDVFEYDEIIKIINKSLVSLSVNANLCTLTILQDLYNEEDDDEIKENIKNIMLKSLYSIFPSVRDKIIMFFDRRINDLNEEEQKEFVNILKYGDNTRNGGVLWHEGTPWFNPSSKRGFNYYYKNYREECKLILNRVSSDYEMKSEEMWKLVNYSDENSLTIELLKYALKYDESFIREKAIRLIFKNYAFNFNIDELKNYLNEYEHHDVIYGLFRGSLDSWIKYNNESRKLILQYFKNALGLMSVAMRTKKFLEEFEDKHFIDGINWSGINQNNKKILWNVWHDVFVEFLNKFPSQYLTMNEGHMVKVTDESLKYISSNIKFVELANAWFNWLNRYLEYELPDDYGMSVADYLMAGTRGNYANRKELFVKMITINNTSFITTNVKVFLDNWDYLSCEEKKLILNLLDNNRKDIKWIQAVALNRKNLPKKIQIKLLGKSIEKFEIYEFVDILISKNILEECLNVYCGYPEPLSFNGYDHNNYKIWDAVIVEVLKRDQLNRTFLIALREIMNVLYNDRNRIILKNYEMYTNLLTKKEKRKLVFERLFYITIQKNQSNKRVWHLLLQNSSDEEKKLYFDKIVDEIELIENNQIGYDDLFELFDENVVYEEIYRRLPNEYGMFLFVRYQEVIYEEFINNKKKYENHSIKESEVSKSIKAMDDDMIKLINKNITDLNEKVLGFLIDQYKTEAPRLLLTDKMIISSIKKMNINSNELNKLIDENRERFYKVITKNKCKYNDHYVLKDWLE